MAKYKEIGGFLPTLFDFPEMWALNRSRCSGRFNLFFFWLYPVAAILSMPFTLLCFVEVLLTKDNKAVETTGAN